VAVHARQAGESPAGRTDSELEPEVIDMYTFDKTLPDVGMDEALARTREALKTRSFGVLTEIDVKKTMKEKIGADIPDYVILGACNPKMAHEALRLEPRVGAMLPCNVIVRAVDGGVEVSAINPVASMHAIENPELKRVAEEVRAMLQEVVESL
jgi:uncharacterized protein (DUF302 family)